MIIKQRCFVDGLRPQVVWQRRLSDYSQNAVEEQSEHKVYCHHDFKMACYNHAHKEEIGFFERRLISVKLLARGQMPAARVRSC